MKNQCQWGQVSTFDTTNYLKETYFLIIIK